VHFFYEGSTIQNSVEQLGSCVHSSFVNFALHPTPQTKSNGVKSEGSNSTIMVTIQNQTHVHVNFFN